MANEQVTSAENEAQSESAAAEMPPVRKGKPKRRASKSAPKKPKPKLVVFFRHGPAVEPSSERSDEERSLTTNGHDRTKRAARGLSEIVPTPKALFSSPLLRALQTALWVTKAYRGKVKVRTHDALTPGASTDEIRKLIDETDTETIVLIGHEPNLTESVAGLLGLSEPFGVELRRAGCIGVRLDEEGRGTLEWMLAPRMLRRLS